MKKKVIFWCSNIFDFKGGIQVFCEYFLEIVSQLFPEKDIRVYLKLDYPQSRTKSWAENIKFNYSGQNWQFSRTMIFALKLFFSGLFAKNPIIFVMHVNFSPVAFVLSKIKKITFVTVVYGIDVWDLKSKLIIKSLQASSAIVSISQYTINRMKERWPANPAKFYILPCKLPNERFVIKEKSENLITKLGLKKETKVILTICRLQSANRNKGYDEILEALPMLRKKIADLKYILVGKGNDMQRIREIIDRKGLNDIVVLAGFVPDEEIVDYYNLCDVFAMPSRGEGFGIVYLEALACGKPVLVSNRDAGQEVIRNGELGVIVDPDNIEELANSLLQILNGQHPNKNIYNREFLRQKVIEYYGFDVFQSRLKEIVGQYIN